MLLNDQSATTIDMEINSLVWFPYMKEKTTV